MAKIEEIVETTENGGAEETRVYELGFHLDGDLPTEEAKKTYESIRNVVGQNGTIVAEGEPHKMQLAYTISRSEQRGRRDFNTAYFCWIAYEANTEEHSAITATASSESKIVRFIDLISSKEQAQHSQELAELYAKMPEVTEDNGDEVMDSEIDAVLKEVDEVVA